MQVLQGVLVFPDGVGGDTGSQSLVNAAHPLVHPRGYRLLEQLKKVLRSLNTFDCIIVKVGEDAFILQSTSNGRIKHIWRRAVAVVRLDVLLFLVVNFPIAYFLRFPRLFGFLGFLSRRTAVFLARLLHERCIISGVLAEELCSFFFGEQSVDVKSCSEIFHFFFCLNMFAAKILQTQTQKPVINRFLGTQ